MSWVGDRFFVREFVLPDRKSVLKGYARDVDWDARLKRRQQEDLGVEDEQQPQVGTLLCVYAPRLLGQGTRACLCLWRGVKSCFSECLMPSCRTPTGSVWLVYGGFDAEAPEA